MFKNAVLFATVILTALLAGILYAYACSVNPGLHRLPDAAYLLAMQEINRAIQNPAFFVCFMGPIFLLPWQAWQYRKSAGSAFKWLLFAVLFYWLGVFGVTIFCNVPLNQTLDVFDISHASPENLAAQRRVFEGPWGRWHLLRTIAAVISAGLGLGAVFSRKLVTDL